MTGGPTRGVAPPATEPSTTDSKGPHMKEFMVEMHGDVREIYVVQAETAEEAAENWATGDMYLSESSSLELYSVTEDNDFE